MADYSALPFAQYDSDSIAIEDTFTKLDQNPHAMFEGAAGAPRLQAAATDGVSAGDVVAHRYYDRITEELSWTKAGEIFINKDSTIRFKTWIYVVTSGNTNNVLNARIYKNGVAFGALHSRSGAAGSESSWSEDLAFSAGDVAQIYISSTIFSASAFEHLVSVQLCVDAWYCPFSSVSELA